MSCAAAVRRHPLICQNLGPSLPPRFQHACTKSSLVSESAWCLSNFNKKDIPNEIEFPRINPKLNDYKFPTEIFSDSFLSKCLSLPRIERIRDSIKNNQGMIEYKAPWLNEINIKLSVIDMIISQAVLEHIHDLELAYRVMNSWLKSDGFMTHSIDFKSHGNEKKDLCTVEKLF